MAAKSARKQQKGAASKVRRARRAPAQEDDLRQRKQARTLERRGAQKKGSCLPKLGLFVLVLVAAAYVFIG